MAELPIDAACRQLELRAERERSFRLGDVEVYPSRFFPDLGSPAGALLFFDFNQFRGCLMAPSDRPPFAAHFRLGAETAGMDLDGFKDLFAGWGWFGDEALRPAWLTARMGDEAKSDPV